jgi:hypothetical protein
MVGTLKKIKLEIGGDFLTFAIVSTLLCQMFITVFFYVALQPSAAHGLPIHKVS